MNENIIKRNELLAQKVIRGLASRNMTGYYAADAAEAVKLALALIPEGGTVTMGGATSAHEIGLVDAVKAGNYQFIDRDAMTDKRAAMLAAYDADVFLSGINAMTEDGELVNIDGNGNRLAGQVYGRKRLFIVAGTNKICPDFDSALARARNVAATRNALRFEAKKTPCKLDGKCHDCRSADRICNALLVLWAPMGGMTSEIILIDEELGY